MEVEAKNPCHSLRGKVGKLEEKGKGEGADMLRNPQIISLTHNRLIYTSEYQQPCSY
jgi:hypothetical protein